MSDSLSVGLKFGRSAKLELRLPENDCQRIIMTDLLALHVC